MDRSAILTTKLAPPRSAAQVVARNRLLAGLHRPGTIPLTLICAPAGYGKTTFTRQYLQEEDVSFAWLSLEAADNDPQRFLRYLVAALRTVIADFADQLFQALSRSGTVGLEQAVSTVINALSDQAQNVILVLDDYHEIREPVIHQSVGFLLEHSPSNFSVVITTRREPPLPLARLRARRQLQEVDTRQLRFIDQDLADYLQLLAITDIDVEHIQQLNKLTEGWIAGLQLALVAVRDEAGFRRRLQEFSGRDRFIMDYLVGEVLEGEDLEMQQFLLRTSILPRINASLAAAVCDLNESRAQELLQDLLRRNMFVFSLDNQQQWYRYHKLFADLMQHQLARSGANTVSEAHIAASTWYERQMMLEPAMEHALQSGSIQLIANIVDRHGDDMIRSLQGPVLFRWGQNLPEPVISGAGPLRLIPLIISAIVSGQPIPPRWEQRARELHEGASELGAGAHSLAVLLACLDAMTSARKRDFNGALRRLQELDQHFHMDPDNPFLHQMYMLFSATIAYWQGNLTRSDALLTEILPPLIQSRNGAMYFPAVLNLVIARCQQADMEGARHSLLSALDTVSEWSWQHTVGHGWLALGQGDIYFEQFQLQDATAAYQLAARLTRDSPTNTIYLLAQARLALIAGLEGKADTDGVGQVMAEEHRANNSFIMAEYDWRIAEMLIGLQRLDEADAWLARCNISINDEPAPGLECLYLCLARLAVCRQQGMIVWPLLSRVLEVATNNGREWVRLEAELLQGLLLLASGKTRQARERLRAIIEEAGNHGCTRFLYHPAPGMSQLLGDLRQQLPDQPLIESLFKAHAVAAPAGGLTDAPVTEALSPKERKVLELLAKGLSNREIGESLFVSENTVKTHLKHLYTKLRVSSRSQAIVQARHHGLV